MDPLEPRLTIAEVTKQYFQGYSERYIRDLARQGEFGKKLVRLGKGWMIPVSAVAAYFERHTFAVASDPERATNPAAYKKRISNLVQFRS
jgi:hypothetical protein